VDSRTVSPPPCTSQHYAAPIGQNSPSKASPAYWCMLSQTSELRVYPSRSSINSCRRSSYRPAASLLSTSVFRSSRVCSVVGTLAVNSVTVYHYCKYRGLRLIEHTCSTLTLGDPKLNVVDGLFQLFDTLEYVAGQHIPTPAAVGNDEGHPAVSPGVSHGFPRRSVYRLLHFGRIGRLCSTLGGYSFDTTYRVADFRPGGWARPPLSLHSAHL